MALAALVIAILALMVAAYAVRRARATESAVAGQIDYLESRLPPIQEPTDPRLRTLDD